MKLLLMTGLMLAATGCAKGGGGGAPTSCANATQGASSSVVTTSGTNVIPVYIADSSTTGSVGYTNEPLVSVTICSPNHTLGSQCQTISNILLDTGSFGLRVFGSAINSNVALSQQTVSVSGQTFDLAECATFGSGADWGAVANGDVVMGNQTASNIPIEVIDINYSKIPNACLSLGVDADPCAAMYNGILGVGLFTQDCGNDCDSSDVNTNPGNYFACNANGCFNEYSGACAGGTCAVQAPNAQQVLNPISGFGLNGGVLAVNSVPNSGGSAVQGTFTMGISSLGAATVYGADASGMTDGQISDFETIFTSDAGKLFGTIVASPGITTQAFIDSGSNGLFFPAVSGLATCSDNDFFCAAGHGVGSPLALSAQIQGYSGAPNSGAITVDIADADSLFDTGFSALPTLGAPISNTFVWGLPFFYGRTVYVGLDGQTFSGHPGPYWAF